MKQGVLLCPMMEDFLQHWPGAFILMSLQCWSLWNQEGLQWCKTEGYMESKGECFVGLPTVAEDQCWNASAAETAAAHTLLVAGTASSIRKVGSGSARDLEMELPMQDWRAVQTEPTKAQKLTPREKTENSNLKIDLNLIGQFIFLQRRLKT